MDSYPQQNDGNQLSLAGAGEDRDGMNFVPDYKIHNIVATFSLNKTIPLEEAVAKLRNAEYNPRRFGALIVRIRDPKCTALIFKSGKVVLAGTKSRNDVDRATKKFVTILSKFISITKVDEIKASIHNIVAVGDYKFPIRLEGLSIDHIDSTTYEPELFSGLIYRMMNPKVVLLIFVSGKVVVTGAKDDDDIKKAFSRITPVLYSCR
ncbi:hypothetical protein WA556_003949, partial [Blastocystis sp. ATCC 50177/Nand II]